MKTMIVSEFKAKAISVLKEVRETGKPVAVTLRGQPLAEVVPPASTPAAEVKLGTGKALTVKRLSDSELVEKGFAEEWETLA